MQARQTAGEHYSALEGFFKRLSPHLAIRHPLWLPGCQNMDEALTQANTYMANICHPARGQCILDAGCGLGGTAFCLAQEFGVRVLGVSDSASNIARCRELAKERGIQHLTEFQPADLMTTELPKNAFDVVWNLESLNYLSPKQQFIQKTFTWLKPGGIWVCMDRYGSLPGDSDKSLTTGYYTPAHWESAEALQTYMRQTGFVDVHYENLTEYALEARARQRLGGRHALLATLASVWHPASLRALLRAFRVIRSSYDLMNRGYITYGLLRGTKPL